MEVKVTNAEVSVPAVIDQPQESASHNGLRAKAWYEHDVFQPFQLAFEPHPKCSAIAADPDASYKCVQRCADAEHGIGHVIDPVEDLIPGETSEKWKQMLADAERRELQLDEENDQRSEEQRRSARPRTISRSGLCVTIYQAHPCPSPRRHRSRAQDRAIVLANLLRSILQIVMAAIPGLYGDWIIIAMVAIAISIVPLFPGLDCSRNCRNGWKCNVLSAEHSGATVSLTSKYRYQHAIIILGTEKVLRLEYLEEKLGFSCSEALLIVGLIANYGLFFLEVYCNPLNLCYFVPIGALACLRSCFLANIPSHNENLNLHLTYEQDCVQSTIMGALMETEIFCARHHDRRGIGKSLIPILFATDLWSTESEWWELPLNRQEDLFNRGFWSKLQKQQREMLNENCVLSFD